MKRNANIFVKDASEIVDYRLNEERAAASERGRGRDRTCGRRKDGRIIVLSIIPYFSCSTAAQHT